MIFTQFSGTSLTLPASQLEKSYCYYDLIDDMSSTIEVTIAGEHKSNNVNWLYWKQLGNKILTLDSKKASQNAARVPWMCHQENAVSHNRAQHITITRKEEHGGSGVLLQEIEYVAQPMILLMAAKTIATLWWTAKIPVQWWWRGGGNGYIAEQLDGGT